MLLRKENFDSEMIVKCAELYCQIWKEPPWNEDFWKPEDVIKEMHYQLSKKNSLALMLLAENSVIGFSWGYEVSQNDLREISGNRSLDNLFNGNNVFYIDELGVESSIRNYGNGKMITKELLQLVAKKGFGIITLRTDLRAIPARRVYLKAGFQELPVLDNKYSTRSYWLLTL